MLLRKTEDGFYPVDMLFYEYKDQLKKKNSIKIFEYLIEYYISKMSNKTS